MRQLACQRRMQTLLVARLAGFVERFHLLAPSGIPVTRVSDMSGGRGDLIKQTPVSLPPFLTVVTAMY